MERRELLIYDLLISTFVMTPYLIIYVKVRLQCTIYER